MEDEEGEANENADGGFGDEEGGVEMTICDNHNFDGVYEQSCNFTAPQPGPRRVSNTRE
ncbi:unnamed protein product [Prunus brigantina]